LVWGQFSMNKFFRTVGVQKAIFIVIDKFELR